MTWLAWRQFRIAALSVFAALAVVCVVLAVTGPDLVGKTNFSDDETMFVGTVLVLYVLPAIIGVFWGVPVVSRELEAGTHSLVWNQTITRRRWLTTKLGVGALTAMVAAGLLSLAVTWWASPIDTLASQGNDSDMLSRITPAIFAARGIVPIGYAAFAFVLGVAVGMALRRTVAAMAVTLVAFVAVMVAVPLFLRPYILPPLEETVTISESTITEITGNEGGLQSIEVTNPVGAWVLTNETVDPSGNAVSSMPDFVNSCLPAHPPQGGVAPPPIVNIRECIAKLGAHGYHQSLTYQPGYRFWPLQWIELTFFLALSALLTWFCFRRIRHIS